MILSLIIIGIIGLVAYFHYLQGFFSAAVSAVISVIAALVAVGYHETLVEMVNGGKFSDYANAVCLASIYAIVYIVLRTLFDQTVPGNVRYPLMVDKIGAAAMGAIAGLFAAGIVALTAQSIGLGPSLAMYERYPITWGRQMIIRAADKNRPDDATFDVLDAEKFLRNESGDYSSLWVPADELVLKLVKMTSSAGASLDCGRPFEAIHPDYLQEMFGLRVGIQSGSKHTALANTVDVPGVYTAAEFAQDDPERWQNENLDIGVRGPAANPNLPALPAKFSPRPGKTILVIRARFGRINADDKTNLVAFTPASARLVMGGRNHFPIGTLEGGRILYRNAPDDLLFAPGDTAADLVYELPEADAIAPVVDKAAPPRLAAGAFFEFKRYARVTLGEREIRKGVEPPGELVQMHRKEGSKSGGADVAKGPLTFEGNPQLVASLPSPINIEDTASDAKGEQDWGKFALQERKFAKLEISPVRTNQFLASGKNQVDEFFVPEGQKMLQLNARPAAKVEDKWAWIDGVRDYQLVDGAAKKYQPLGAFAKVKTSDGQDMIAGAYDLTRPVRSIPSDRNMRPTDVVLIFVVPRGTDLKSLDYKGEVTRPMNLKVPG